MIQAISAVDSTPRIAVIPTGAPIITNPAPSRAPIVAPPAPPAPPPVAPAKIDEIQLSAEAQVKLMYQEGQSIQQISTALGIDLKTITGLVQIGYSASA